MRILDLVIDGKKPGCFLSFDQFIFDELERIVYTIRKENLESLPSRPAWRRKKFEVTTHAIGRKRKCQEIIIERGLPKVPELKKRVARITSALKGKSTAEALVFLDGYSRIDKKYTVVEDKNLERPEVALVEGILLGYRNCCVIYYIQTRYFGMSVHRGAEYLFRKEAN